MRSVQGRGIKEYSGMWDTRHATMLYGQVASFDAKYRPMYVTLLKETHELSPDWPQVVNKAGF